MTESLLGSGEGISEIVESSFAVQDAKLRVRVKMAYPGEDPDKAFALLQVWVIRDQVAEGAPAAWVGRDSRPVYDAHGNKSIELLDEIVCLNAARFDSRNGVARLLNTLVRSYEADMGEAQRVLQLAATEVGIREAEDEVRGDLLLAAGQEVRNAMEAAKQKVLAAARQDLMLKAASPEAPAGEEPKDSGKKNTKNRRARSVTPTAEGESTS